MIRLVVGLGNPGQKYEQTRHNVGFLFLDAMFGGLATDWSLDARFEGLVSSCLISGSRIYLLKPATFMNRSGCSVGKMVRYYKLTVDEVLVVHDELDFDVGVAKLKRGGGHAGHNGLRDIISHLSSSDFYRLRMGIGRPRDGKNVADYVLSCPANKEAELLMQVFECCKQPVKQMIAGDIEKAMNGLNALNLEN